MPAEMHVDYYELLTVSKQATPTDIRKAYRKMALKWHPDRNPNNKEEAEEKFKKISEAYEVLGDEEKRRIYDQYGLEGVKAGGRPHPSARRTTSEPGDFGGASPSFGSHFAGFSGSPFGASPFGAAGSRFGGFRDPFEMFREMFGDDDPFSHEFFSRSSSRSSLFDEDPFFASHRRESQPHVRVSRSTSSSSQAGAGVSPMSSSPMHRSTSSSFFSSSFGSFGGGDVFGGDPFGSFSGGGASMVSESVSTTISNGRKIVRKRSSRGGSMKETVEEFDNSGRMVRKTIDGVPQAVSGSIAYSSVPEE